VYLAAKDYFVLCPAIPGSCTGGDNGQRTPGVQRIGRLPFPCGTYLDIFDHMSFFDERTNRCIRSKGRRGWLLFEGGSVPTSVENKEEIRI